MPTGQKRVPDIIIDSYGCWELNSGPLGEQTVLLTSEPSLQPLKELFNFTKFFMLVLEAAFLDIRIYSEHIVCTYISKWHLYAFL